MRKLARVPVLKAISIACLAFLLGGVSPVAAQQDQDAKRIDPMRQPHQGAMAVEAFRLPDWGKGLGPSPRQPILASGMRHVILPPAFFGPGRGRLRAGR